MANPTLMCKEYLAVLYFILIIVLFLLLGCSRTAPIVVEKPVIVTVPEFRDTAIVLRDTVIVKDSLWYGEVTDSLGKVIGDLKIYFKKKIAELKLNEKHDTVYIKDTILVSDNSNSILPVVNTYFEWWEKALLYGGIGSILSLIIYLRVKRGKL